MASSPRTPRYSLKQVSLSGEDVTELADVGAKLQGRLVGLRLTDNPGFEADTLEITIDDTDGKIQIPPRGSLLQLGLGYKDSALVNKGIYTTSEIEYSGPPDTLTVRAHAADLRASLNLRREQSWHETKLGQLVTAIGIRNKLTARISESLADIDLVHEDQAGETDASFLTRLASLYDAITTVKQGTLIFMARGLATTVSGKAIPSSTIKRNEVDSYRFALSDRSNFTAVIANWHDNSTGKKGSVTVGEETTEESASDEVATGANGIKVLKTTYAKQARARQAAQTEWASIKANKAEADIYKGVVAYWWVNKAKKQKSSVMVNDTAKTKAASKNTTTATNNFKVLRTTYGSANNARAAAQKEWDKLEAAGNKIFNGVQAFWMDSAAKVKRPVYWTAAMSKKTDTQTEPSAENAKVLRHTYASFANAKRAAEAEYKALQRGRATLSLTLTEARPEIMPEMPIKLEGFKPFICNNEWIVARVTHEYGDNGYTMPIELEVKMPSPEN